MSPSPVRRLALCLAAGLLAGSGAAHAAAAPARPVGPTPGTRVSISADELSIDAASRVARATGHVRITDGVTTAMSSRATLFQKEGRGVLAGQARVVGPSGVLEGDEITVEYTARAIRRIVARGTASLEVETSLVSAQAVTLVPSTDTVTAEPRVTVFTKPDLVATGNRLTYRRSRGIAVLDGRARVQSSDGFIEGGRLESDRRWERLTVAGDVHGIFRDVEVRSRNAEVSGVEKKAVFTGDVRLAQPGRRLTTDKVTVWYASGRVVAEGQTWIRLEPQP
ncbi:MAG: LptA/OstA family protein [Armatimonadota bacterium]